MVLHIVLYRDREVLAVREDRIAIPEAERAPLLAAERCLLTKAKTFWECWDNGDSKELLFQ